MLISRNIIDEMICMKFENSIWINPHHTWYDKHGKCYSSTDAMLKWKSEPSVWKISAKIYNIMTSTTFVFLYKIQYLMSESVEIYKNWKLIHFTNIKLPIHFQITTVISMLNLKNFFGNCYFMSTSMEENWFRQN